MLQIFNIIRVWDTRKIQMYNPTVFHLQGVFLFRFFLRYSIADAYIFMLFRFETCMRAFHCQLLESSQIWYFPISRVRGRPGHTTENYIFFGYAARK